MLDGLGAARLPTQTTALTNCLHCPASHRERKDFIPGRRPLLVLPLQQRLFCWDTQSRRRPGWVWGADAEARLERWVISR